MLGKLPDERFASVEEAIQALTRAIEVPPPAAIPPSPPTAPIAPAPPILETTLPSPVHTAKPKRPLVLAAAIGAAVVLAAIVIIAVLVMRGPSGQSPLPPELAAALADWNDGKYEPAGAAIGKAILASPELAERDDVGRPLAAPVADETARRALTKLLETTALGRSHAMASALADVAVADDPKRRDVALVLLRERQDLLSKEQAARTRLRDAETCEALDGAKASATDVATSATKRDLERVTTGECKSLLRVTSLCDTCAGAPVKAASRSGAAAPTTAQPKPAPPAPPAPPPSPDNAHGKAHGKGKGK